MRHYEIAVVIIDQADHYCLQLRGKESNGVQGMLGFFGGAIEPGESPGAAACREVREESSLSPQIDEVEPVGEVKVISERDNQAITAHAWIYRFKIKPDIQVKAKEGEVVIVPKNAVTDNLDQMSPVARAAFEEILLKET